MFGKYFLMALMPIYNHFKYIKCKFGEKNTLIYYIYKKIKTIFQMQFWKFGFLKSMNIMKNFLSLFQVLLSIYFVKHNWEGELGTVQCRAQQQDKFQRFQSTTQKEMFSLENTLIQFWQTTKKVKLGQKKNVEYCCGDSDVWENIVEIPWKDARKVVVKDQKVK